MDRAKRWGRVGADRGLSMRGAFRGTWVLAVCLGAASAAWARTGAEVYEAECAACHGLAGDGKSQGAAWLPVPPRDFVRGKFKLRSTESGESPTRQDVLDTVTRGIFARGMPAFDFLPEEERRAVVEHVLRLSGRKEGRVASLPAGSAGAAERGKAAYERVGCGKCHLPNAADQLPAELDLKDESGAPLRSPHLLNDEYIGADDPREIVKRMTLGMDGTPMPSYSGAMSAEEMWAIAKWLKENRDVRNYTAETARYRDPLVRAQILIERFRCRACHVIGAVGAPIGPSLDTAGPKLRVEWIRAWLTDPRTLGKFLVDRPYRMPDLKLTQREVEDLTRFILAAGKRSVTDEAPIIAATDTAKLRAGESLYRVMCPRCHALGSEIPASVPKPTGPDLIRMAERLHYPWLEAAIVSEGCTPEQAVTVRDFLWKTCTEKGPKPPVLPAGK